MGGYWELPWRRQGWFATFCYVAARQTIAARYHLLMDSHASRLGCKGEAEREGVRISGCASNAGSSLSNRSGRQASSIIGLLIRPPRKHSHVEDRICRQAEDRGSRKKALHQRASSNWPDGKDAMWNLIEDMILA